MIWKRTDFHVAALIVGDARVGGAFGGVSSGLSETVPNVGHAPRSMPMAPS